MRHPAMPPGPLHTNHEERLNTLTCTPALSRKHLHHQFPRTVGARLLFPSPWAARTGTGPGPEEMWSSTSSGVVYPSRVHLAQCLATTTHDNAERGGYAADERVLTR
jgi:hypothetical protein